MLYRETSHQLYARLFKAENNTEDPSVLQPSPLEIEYPKDRPQKQAMVSERDGHYSREDHGEQSTRRIVDCCPSNEQLVAVATETDPSLECLLQP